MRCGALLMYPRNSVDSEYASSDRTLDPWCHAWTMTGHNRLGAGRTIMMSLCKEARQNR
jgi:hypothetical protein